MTKEPRVGSTAWLRFIYRFLNTEFFDNKLPKRLPVVWAKLPGTLMARVRWRSYRTVTRGKGKRGKRPLVIDTRHVPLIMQIDRRLKGQHLQKQVGMSMVHEMAHLVLGVHVECTEWGGKFDRLMFRLCRKGAFQRFW